MATMVKTVEPIRNPAATTTGLGTGVVLTWLYNDILAPRYQLPPMPDAVIVVLSPLLLDIIRFFLTRNKQVEEPVRE